MDHLPETVGHEVERNYVKCTYDTIADDFSSTRYKKWPKVEAFLEDQPCASLMLDIGCGNGKYLDNQSTFNIGCDSSSELLRICRSRKFEVVQCDMMRLPFREDSFDVVICIAALHHIVMAQRRQTCLEGMIDRITSNGGKLLIQVWAFEQELEKDNPYLKKQASISKRDEMQEVILDEVVRIPIHKNRTPFTNQDLLVPFNVKQNPQVTTTNRDQGKLEQQHLRYYHVFKQNELDLMLEAIPSVKMLASYYDKGNWCAIVSRNQSADSKG